VKRVIYCGTIGIFGHRFAGVCNEDSEKRPGNIYEKTKLAAEELALGYFASRGLETLSLRPADVYGPRDQRLLKLFRGVARGSFPMFGRGKGRRHMIFVSDVVSAFEKACTVQRGLGKAYIIAGPEVCTLYELVETIRKATGQPRYGFPLPLTPMLVAAAVTEDICATIGVAPPIYRRRMDFFTSDCAFDISRARDVLDWTPRVNLSEGVRLTLDAYRTAGLIATARAVQG
jgi:nucleoside-diphosphate-sugar epimerase